jgi:hypothetical protein
MKTLKHHVVFQKVVKTFPFNTCSVFQNTKASQEDSFKVNNNASLFFRARERLSFNFEHQNPVYN